MGVFKGTPMGIVGLTGGQTCSRSEEKNALLGINMHVVQLSRAKPHNPTSVKNNRNVTLQFANPLLK